MASFRPLKCHLGHESRFLGLGVPSCDERLAPLCQAELPLLAHPARTEPWVTGCRGGHPTGEGELRSPLRAETVLPVIGSPGPGARLPVGPPRVGGMVRRGDVVSGCVAGGSGIQRSLFTSHASPPLQIKHEV